MEASVGADTESDVVALATGSRAPVPGAPGVGGGLGASVSPPGPFWPLLCGAGVVDVIDDAPRS